MTDRSLGLLIDGFDRIHQQVPTYADLSREVLRWRPDPEANSIGWLLWHLSRVQDDHVSELAGAQQIWIAQGWHDRTAVPFPAAATGYGQSADEVGRLDVTPADLVGYHDQVHQMTVDYLTALSPAALDEVVDRRWDPPVTAAVRLVSVVNDCAEHLGQAAYVWGMARRRGL